MSEIPNSKRLPRNAAAPIPFTSPAQAFFDQYIPTASPSAYSEIDVILDDGTLQRRTVSLSTLPEDDLLPEDDEPPYEPPYQPPYEPEHDESHKTVNTPLLSGPKKKTYGDEDSDDSSDNFTRKWTFDGLTAQQKLVLKCSFAYILGCLFTFVPTLNALIGNNRVSSHLVATATVFFNPAKSLGGMVEAALYGWGYTLFAVTICLGSMLTTDFFIDRQETLMAHTFSLVWLAAATFVIAFLKAHWNKPPVATASSLCFIIIFIIVVREGSANKGDFDTTRIEQITFAVATGTLITVSCCILFWPISASKKLRKEFEATLTSYKVLLKLLTKTFLLDDDLPEFTANQSLQTAIESHRTTFTSLEKSLKEAKLEVWNTEIHSCITEYEEVVKSMQRLAQSMGGIKSSCGLQFEWIKKNYKVKSDRQIKKHKDLTDFVHSIRQPLKSLAFTCKQTLLHLQVEFSDLPRTGPSDDTLIDNLQKAMVLFDVSQKKAMERLNRKRYVPTDDVFLVYFFVFNMLEFARDLSSLVESVRSLSLAKEKKQGGFGLFLGYFTAPKSETSKSVKFVPNERHKMNTLHTPIPKTKWRRIVLRLWATFSLFKLQKIRYAVKATIAAVLLASLAFLPSTGLWFREWRMEWALITLMVVMTPTVGGTNLVSVYRIFSTMLGCFTAMFLYLLFPDQMISLILCTWLFSIPNFWMILHHKHGKFGQFTLLAYNLVMLNKYNDRETHQVEVTWLATIRCLSILLGVVFGLFVTAYVWPYEARVELRKGVSDLLLRLAWLYQKLVHSNSQPNEEIVLQRTLLELQELLVQTPNEPRLKGAFPVETYRCILTSCQNIMERLSLLRKLECEEIKQRKEMVGNILLYFYILASAMRLKTPLPPYLPPARKAWETMVDRLKESMGEREDVYLFYYAYVTVLEDIIRELDKLGKNMTLLFGAIVPENQWEGLFPDVEQNQISY